MDKWIADKIEENQLREYELERFESGVEPFLKTLAQRICTAVDHYTEKNPEQKPLLHVKPNKPNGLLFTRSGPNGGQAAEFRVIPERSALQCGPVNSDAKVNIPLKLDEAGKLALEGEDWDSLLERFLGPVLFPNS